MARHLGANDPHFRESLYKQTWCVRRAHQRCTNPHAIAPREQAVHCKDNCADVCLTLLVFSCVFRFCFSAFVSHLVGGLVDGWCLIQACRGAKIAAGHLVDVVVLCYEHQLAL